jgi:hypothetical protein
MFGQHPGYFKAVFLKQTRIHCRVPDKEWSFQDGGLYNALLMLWFLFVRNFFWNKTGSSCCNIIHETRVPDKEWSFQDGGLYIIKKVGVKILTIIVLYRLS